MGEAVELQEPRRERLKRERREQILDAAAIVFAKKGYSQATIRDIARQADVADGTIYNYFESKFDLLIAIITRLVELEQLTLDLPRVSPGKVRDFFVPAIQQRLLRLRDSEEMFKAVLPQVLATPELRARFYQEYVLRIANAIEGFVQGQMDLGGMRRLDAQLVTRAVQGMLLGLIILRILGDKPLQEQWEDVPDLLATILFDGLSLAGGD